jgi:DNA-binding transcriptional regulator GbsR (MarR family)
MLQSAETTPMPNTPRRNPPAPTGDAILDALEDRLCDAMGGIIRFWGFGPHAGRVWALLYLDPRPLSAPEIARRLHLSAGSVSQTLTLLQRWGVVRRFRAPGRKLLLHTGTHDVWTSVARVLGEREAKMVRDLVDLLRDLLARTAAARAAGAAPERAAHVELRLRSLLRLARVAAGILEAMLAAGTLDLGPLRRVMRLATRRAP